MTWRIEIVISYLVEDLKRRSKICPGVPTAEGKVPSSHEVRVEFGSFSGSRCAELELGDMAKFVSHNRNHGRSIREPLKLFLGKPHPKHDCSVWSERVDHFTCGEGVRP